MLRSEISGDNFSILALDGGGTRGIYAAQILVRVEEALGVPVKDCFDLIAGTSTGSIVAAGAAVGIPMATIADLFEGESKRIFGKPRFAARLAMLFRSRYSSEPLEEVLAGYVPHLTLSEVPIPLMITSADLTTGEARIFKSKYAEDQWEPHGQDGDVLLRDAVLASCAAPIYFDPKQIGQDLLVDGGLWANNPSSAALTEAVSAFEKSVDHIRVLSIGSGHVRNMFGKRRRWGLLTGWGSEKLVFYTLMLQSQASTAMVKLLLKHRYLRLNPEVTIWELDDTKHLGTTRALADRDFTDNSRVILDHIRGVAP